MPLIGWYYLHTNGNLIYKRELGETAGEIRESSFARALWPVDPENREYVWRILIEALAAGADKTRITELSKKWECSDEDADVYADRVGCNIFKDGDKWCATDGSFVNLQQSPAGFGDTKLEAMASLALELGYIPSKLWGATFHDLLNEGRQVDKTG